MANVVYRKGQPFPGSGGGGSVSPDDFEESSYISTVYGSVPTSSGEQLSKTNVYATTLSGGANKFIAYGGRHGTDMGILDSSNNLDDYEDGIEYVLGYGYDENGVLQFGRAAFGSVGIVDAFDVAYTPTGSTVHTNVGTVLDTALPYIASVDIITDKFEGHEQGETWIDDYFLMTYYSEEDDSEHTQKVKVKDLHLNSEYVEYVADEDSDPVTVHNAIEWMISVLGEFDEYLLSDDVITDKFSTVDEIDDDDYILIETASGDLNKIRKADLITGGGGFDPGSLSPNDDAVTLLNLHVKSGTTDEPEIGFMTPPMSGSITPIQYPAFGLGYGYEDIESAMTGGAPKVGWLDMMNQLDAAAGLYGLYLDTSDPTDPDVQFGMLPFDYVVENTMAAFEDLVEEADFVTGSNPDKIDTLLFKDQRGDWKKTDRASFVTNVINKKPFGPDNAMWNGMFIAPWFDRDTENLCDVAPIIPQEVPEKRQDEIFNYKLGYYDDPDNPGEKSLVFTKDDGSSKSVNMFINDSIHLKTPYDFENMIPTSNPLSNLIQVDYYTNHELSIWPAAGGDYLYWEIPSTGLAGKDIEFGMSEWLLKH